MRWIIPLYVIVSVLVGLSVYDWLNKEKDSPNLNVELVGKYKPNRFGFAGHVKGVKPSDLRDR